MRIAKKLSILSSLSLMMFVACTKTGDTGPAGTTGATGPAGPSYTGAMVGHVVLFDQYGSKITTNLAGIQISLSNALNTVTDANGYYVFANIPTGMYTVGAHDTSTATVFGDFKFENVTFIKDTLNRDLKLSATANFAPLTFTAIQKATNDSLVMTFAPDTRPRNVIVFVNSNATVNNSPANYLQAYTKAIPASTGTANTTVTIVVPAGDLYDLGITSGTTAYYAAYGYPVNDASVYEDFTTGKNVYNALSMTSVTASATAPE
jgi:hypothetical protein